MENSRLIIAGLWMIMSAACTPASRHYWEVPSENLEYIARIRDAPYDTSLVIYNPKLCGQIGNACGFFRAHAHAHSMLYHPLLRPENYPASMEAEADCWAARNADPAEVAAAVKFLMDKDRSPDIPVTGNADERARRIHDCAEEVGNWPKQK